MTHALLNSTTEVTCMHETIFIPFGKWGGDNAGYFVIVIKGFT